MKVEELRLQAQLEDTHFWYAARRRQVAARIPPAPHSQARALDLGAGSGGNTRLLSEAGYQAVALEYSPVAARFTHDRGHDVVVADAHRLPFSDGAFELVMGCDVLEHLVDDGAAVREIRRVLAPEGALVATVPADPRLWSHHDVAVSHQRRYTRETLREVLESGGFRLLSLDAWMVLLRPVVLLRRVVTKRGKPAATEMASDLEPVGPLVNAALTGVLRVEEKLPRLSRRAGVSLIVTAVPS
jgi:SAM-dependent methyltransferase